MMQTPAKFRKIPVMISAMPFDGTIESARACVEWINNYTLSGKAYVKARLDSCSIAIFTLEGTMYASEGDWIIQGVSGEFYPCKPDIFQKTYEPVNE